jgi:hypothetical protein
MSPASSGTGAHPCALGPGVAISKQNALDWATDMVWRIEGHSIASKEYSSKHEYLEEFVKPFGARFLASERFRPTNIRSVHADETQ